MIINKPFKTYNQQLKILRSRNLLIPNGSKAIKILRRENYYAVINGYKDIFLDPSHSSDYYKDGTSFDNIYALYCFDRNLRSILLKYILRMESSLKAKIAYRFSEEYPTNFNYLDMKNFGDNIPAVTALIAHISNDIKNNVEQFRPGQKASPFCHYLNVHKELPLWGLMKKLSLGETAHFYAALTDSLKICVLSDVCKEYQKEYRLSAPKVPNSADVLSFTQMLDFIVKFRNICAHGERMYDTVIKRKKNIPQITFFYMNKPLTFSSRFADVIHILGLFLLKSDYKEFVKEISAEIYSVSAKQSPHITNEILSKIGFPKNWENRLNLPR